MSPLTQLPAPLFLKICTYLSLEDETRLVHSAKSLNRIFSKNQSYLLESRFPKRVPMPGMPSSEQYQRLCYEKRWSMRSIPESVVNSRMFRIGHHPSQVVANGRIAVLVERDASYQDLLNIFDIDTGTLLQTLSPDGETISQFEVSADGTKIITRSSLEDGELFIHNFERMQVWDTKTGRLLHTLVHVGEEEPRFKITHDGRRAICMKHIPFSGENIKIWDLETGECLSTINTPNRVSHFELRDNIALLGYGEQGTIAVLSLDTREILSTFHGPPFERFQINSDQTRILTTSWRTIKLWKIFGTGTIYGNLRTFSGCGYDEYSPDLLFQMDSEGTIAALSNPQSTSIWIYDLELETCIRTLDTKERVLALRLSSNGEKLLSESMEERQLWDLKTGRCLRTLVGGFITGSYLEMNDDGTKAWSNPNEVLLFWDLIPSLPEERLTEMVKTPFYCRKLTQSLPDAIQKDLLATQKILLEKTKDATWSSTSDFYNTIRVALPAIRDCFLKAMEEEIDEEKTLLRQSGIRRFLHLPETMKKRVLETLQKLKGSEASFIDSTDQEKLEALRLVIQETFDEAYHLGGALGISNS